MVAGGATTGGVLLATAELYNSTNLVVTPPHLTQPMITGGNSFQFTFTNTPDVSFLVYGASSPSTPFTNWSLLSGPVEISSGVYQFTDSSATNSQRVYRIRAP